MESVRALKIHSSRQDKFVPSRTIQRLPSPRSNPTSWLNPFRYFYQPPTHLKSFPSPSGKPLWTITAPGTHLPLFAVMETSQLSWTVIKISVWITEFRISKTFHNSLPT
jgi:hypothetical protein